MPAGLGQHERPSNPPVLLGGLAPMASGSALMAEENELGNVPMPRARPERKNGPAMAGCSPGPGPVGHRAAAA